MQCRATACDLVSDSARCVLMSWYCEEQLADCAPYVADQTREGFDVAAQPSLDAGRIPDLAACRRVAHGDVASVLGPRGSGSRRRKAPSDGCRSAREARVSRSADRRADEAIDGSRQIGAPDRWMPP